MVGAGIGGTVGRDMVTGEFVAEGSGMGGRVVCGVGACGSAVGTGGGVGNGSGTGPTVGTAIGVEVVGDGIGEVVGVGAGGSVSNGSGASPEAGDVVGGVGAVAVVGLSGHWKAAGGFVDISHVLEFIHSSWNDILWFWSGRYTFPQPTAL